MTEYCAMDRALELARNTPAGTSRAARAEEITQALVAMDEVSERTARRFASTALCDVESAQINGRVLAGECTRASVVFLLDGVERMVSLADLVALVQAHEAAA